MRLLPLLSLGMATAESAVPSPSPLFDVGLDPSPSPLPGSTVCSGGYALSNFGVTYDGVCTDFPDDLVAQVFGGGCAQLSSCDGSEIGLTPEPNIINLITGWCPVTCGGCDAYCEDKDNMLAGNAFYFGTVPTCHDFLLDSNSRSPSCEALYQAGCAASSGICGEAPCSGDVLDCESVVATSPPPPPPPSPPPITYSTELTVVGQGDPSDYSEDDKSEMASEVAEAAGVDLADVTVNIAPASVLITFTITSTTMATAATVEATLEETMGTADGANSVLTGVSVASVEEILTTANSNIEIGGDDEISPALIGGFAGGFVAVLLVGVAGMVFLRGRGGKVGPA